MNTGFWRENLEEIHGFEDRKCIKITWYLSSLTLHTAVVGTVWPLLGSRRNGHKTLYLFQKYLPCWEQENIVSRNKSDPVKVKFCVFFYNLFLLKHFWPSNSLHCLKETLNSCEFYDSVFETDRKRLEMRALCSPSEQVASSPICCQESSSLARTVR